MHLACPGRVIRPGPAVPDVDHVAQQVEVVLPARGCDVQGFAGLQVHPGGHDVHVDTAGCFIVPDRGPGSALRVHPGPGQAFKVVQHFVYLFGRGTVLRRPCYDTGREAVFERQGVGNLADAERVPAQHLNLVTRPALVVFVILKVAGCVGGHPAGPVELNHHD